MSNTTSIILKMTKWVVFSNLVTYIVITKSNEFYKMKNKQTEKKKRGIKKKQMKNARRILNAIRINQSDNKHSPSTDRKQL